MAKPKNEDELASLLSVGRPGRIKLSEIIPWDENPREHDPEQLRMLVKSIKEHGFGAPVLLQEGTNKMVAGHGRRLALQKMIKKGQDPEVPCVWLALADEQAQSYAVADNRLTELSSWDIPVLKGVMAELDNGDFDVEVTGFTQLALDALFGIEPEAPANSGPRDPDDTPPLSTEVITQPGDLIRMGDHLLLCGDSTNPADVERLLEGTKPDLLVTDPPYGVGFEYAEHDDKDTEANACLVAKVFGLHKGVGKVWTPGRANLARDLTRFGEAKVCIWTMGFAMARSGLGGASTWEPILVADPQEAPEADGMTFQPVLVLKPKTRHLPTDVFHYPTERVEIDGQALNKLHPCPKPVALYQHLIQCFSEPGDTIFEPFCGSGTTLLAAHLSGRKCRAIEMTPSYCDLIVRRYEEVTGLKAERL